MGHPKNLLVKVLGEVRNRYGVSLARYLVMPEHIHLLVSKTAKETPSTIMQVLKQRVSRRLRRKTLTPTEQLRLRFQTSDDLFALVLVAALLRFRGVESEEVR